MITLSQEQQEAVNTLADHAKGKVVSIDDVAYTLAGYAGTGKSTVVDFIIRELRTKKVCVSAPTHKAKEVIAEKTNLNAETIQSLLGLRPNIELTDFNPNKLVFEPRAEQRIKFYNVLIIDEASMINKAAYNLILDMAHEFKVKVIFVGDKYQLPPVGEVISQVFKSDKVVSLETIFRQGENNPNQQLIELARNDVRDNTDHCFKFIQQNTTNILDEEGYYILPREEYYPTLLERYYDSEYQQNPNLIKTLVWQNKTADSINGYIRKNLIKSDELVAVGDILMGYKPITKEVNRPPFYIPIVKNAVDYIVKKVDIEERTLFGVKLKGYRVETDQMIEIPMFILHRDSYSDFRYELSARLKKAKDHKMWKSYYDFKNQVALLEPMKDQYGDLICDKDIGYGYAITVHKAQGSTYKYVGVTLADIKKCFDAKDRRKLLYVALSRTSEINYIYG